MNNLCTDIGHMSLTKYGEELCGDMVEVIEQGDDDYVVVLADGLGSYFDFENNIHHDCK